MRSHEAQQNRIVIYLGILFCIGLALSYTPSLLADAGNFSLLSPLACGSNCSGGFEFQGHNATYCDGNPEDCFNTIDDCADGDDPQYEYVNDIFITNINNSPGSFRTGDTISITAELNCDTDGDAVVFAYTNGTEWENKYNSNCSGDSFYNITTSWLLHDVEGNHTVRVMIIFDDANQEVGATCAFDYEETYSDTDDLMFTVVEGVDYNPPTLTNASPSNGTLLDVIQYPSVSLGLIVEDDGVIDTVYANVSWPATNITTVMLTDGDLDGNYTGTFVNTSYFGRYNVTYYANDSTGKNTTLTSYFDLNRSANISIHIPSSGSILLPTFVMRYYTLHNFSANWSGYSVDGNANTTLAPFVLNISNNSVVSTTNLTSENASVNQSFIASFNFTLAAISLNGMRNGTGLANATLTIWNDSSGTPDVQLITYTINTTTVSNTSFTWTRFNLTPFVFIENETYWIQLQGNGSSSDFFAWRKGLSEYADGDCSVNSSEDCFVYIHSLDAYNTSVSVSKGTHTLLMYANDSSSTIYSALFSFIVDNTAPTVHTTNYTPSSDVQLDPETSMTFQANITDNLDIDTVYLQYALDSGSWQTANTTQVSDIFTANMTPNSSGNWSWRWWYNDTANNMNTSAITSKNISYEYNWSIIPTTMNDTGGPLDSNVSLGIFSIINDADIALTFNISQSADTSPIIFINGTKESDLLVVDSQTQATLNFTAQTLSISGESLVQINITSLNASATPASTTLNNTLRSNNTGVHLSLSFVSYYAEVTLGDERKAYTVRVSNVGTTTATGVNLTWQMPSGWVNKSSLFADVGTLAFGATQDVTLRVNIPSSEDTGVVSMGAVVNSSQNVSDTIEKNITVVSGSGGSTPSPSGNSGSGSSSGSIGGTITIVDKDLVLHYPSTMQGIRGESLNFSVVIENPSSAEYVNVSLQILEFPPSKLEVIPKKKTILKDTNETYSIILDIPIYYAEGTHTKYLFVESTYKENPYNLTSPIVLEIGSVPADDVWVCIESVQSQLAVLTKESLPLSRIEKSMQEIIHAYQEGKYDAAEERCKETENSMALVVALGEQFSEMMLALEKNNIGDASIYEGIDHALSLFNAGNYEQADQELQTLSVLIEDTLHLKQEALQKQQKTLLWWIALLVVVVLVGVTYTYWMRWWISLRITVLEKRMSITAEMQQSIQKQYFQQKRVGKSVYQTWMKAYAEKIASYNTQIIQYELLAISYSVSRQKRKNAQKVYLAKIRKHIQKELYHDKSMTKETAVALLRGVDGVEAKIK